MNTNRPYHYTDMALADANALRAIALPTPGAPTLTEADLRACCEQEAADSRAWEAHLAVRLNGTTDHHPHSARYSAIGG